MKIANIFKLLSKIIFKKEVDELKIKLAMICKKIEKNNIRISDETISMLILAEDHRFFSHGGVDLIAICRAIFKTIFLFKIEGGSTIEQQLVRVVTGRYQRTISRKIKEIILASVIQDLIEKNEILRLYLCLAYYGYQMNGYQQCAKRISINPDNLNEIESANLIARLKYPQPHSINGKNHLLIANRVNFILNKYASMKEKSGDFSQKRMIN